MTAPEIIVHKAIGHAIFKHDLNISDDLFIIRSCELDDICREATKKIMEAQS